MSSLATTAPMDAVLRPDNFRLAPRFDADAQAAFVDHARSSMRAQTVLEVGTLGGYAALWLVAVAGAAVTSIEADAHHHAVAVENVAWGSDEGEADGGADGDGDATPGANSTPAATSGANSTPGAATPGDNSTPGADTTPESRGRVHVLHGRAEDVMPALIQQGRRFDMVFIDADMEGQDRQFDWAVQLTRPGGCVWLDDVVASMIQDGYGVADHTHNKETILDRIGRDERVQAATLVPTAVCHPMVAHPVFNGFLLAMVQGHH